jgi:hypothetical protein
MLAVCNLQGPQGSADLGKFGLWSFLQLSLYPILRYRYQISDYSCTGVMCQAWTLKILRLRAESQDLVS